MKHIVIAGGGFAGVRLARRLAKQRHIHITLINDSPDFRYSPALYRAATGSKIGTARIPLEWMLLDAGNTDLVIGKVTGIDEKDKHIKLEDGQKIAYDFAVLSLGAVTTYFGIDGLSEHSYGVKSFEEILELKHHIHDSLIKKSPHDQNFVIIGAGPTGVELAGALGSYLKRVAKKHQIKNPTLKVHLIEAGPRILPQLSARAATKTQRRLEKLGVQVMTNTLVKSETKKTLHTSNGDIKTEDVIWTAGTANNPFFKQHEALFNFDKRGKVVVNKRLQTSPNVYVCGDNASTKFSGLALTAIGHANYLAKDITARTKHKKRKNLKEHHPVQVVPTGHRWAVLQYRKLVLTGWPISIVRKVADIVGYTDVLGPLKAMTIWTNTEHVDEHCASCQVI